jgi:polar amino acid transport system substrate-binding protein
MSDERLFRFCRSRLLAGLLLLGAAASWAQAPGSAKRPLRICATETPGVPAEVWRQAGLRPAADGSVDDFVLALVARRLQLTIALTIAPSRRCPLGVIDGHFDGVLSLSPTPERMSWGRYPMRKGEPDESLRYLRTGYSLYMRQEGPWRWDGRELQGGSRPPVGMITGYSGVPLVRQRGLEVVETTAAPTALLRMLAAGRFDLVALPDSDGQLVLARDAALNRSLVRLEPPVVERDYYLVLARPLAQAHPQLAARLWQALALENQSELAQRARREARP